VPVGHHTVRLEGGIHPIISIHPGADIAAAIVAATIGAILLLIILKLVNIRGRW
jgi:uncharacterized membrane protein YeaQ/YmgE (transglycosylase-associated protein family)